VTTATTLATRAINPRIGTEIRADKATLLSGEHAPTTSRARCTGEEFFF
jgi:hypothetical protein